MRIAQSLSTFLKVLLISMSFLMASHRISYASSNEAWDTSECSVAMNGVATALDQKLYKRSLTGVKGISDPSQFLGKSYRMEEMLAVVDRHLELLQSDDLETYRAWVKEVFLEKNNVLITTQSVPRLDPAKWQVDWADWKTIQPWKNSLRKLFFDNPVKSDVRRVRKIFSKLSASESYREADFVVDWKSVSIENERELFLVEQELLRILAKTQYQHLRTIRSFFPTSKYFRNFDLVRDHYLFQYQLEGKFAVEPSTLDVVKEAGGVLGNLSLGLLLPRAPALEANYPMFSWIYENYGLKGASDYLYIRKGPRAAISYLIRGILKARTIALATLVMVYSGTIMKVYNYYEAVNHVENGSTIEPKADDLSFITDSLALPEVQSAPAVGDTTGIDPEFLPSKTAVITHLTQNERNEMNALFKKAAAELNATSPR